MPIEFFLALLYMNTDGDEIDSHEISLEVNATCQSSVCERAAFRILNDIDPNVNPCDDFYKFTCGGFIKRTVIPGDKQSVNSFDTVKEELQRQIISSIESDDEETDSRSLKLLKTYYRTCMNIIQIDKTSEDEFIKILNDFGGWPILDGKSLDDSSFDWKNLAYKINSLGFTYPDLVSVFISVDARNSSKRTIQVTQPIFQSQRDYLSKGIDSKHVKSLLKSLVEIAVIFGADRNQSEKVLRESMEFRIALAEISLSGEELRKVSTTYNPMTVKQLVVKYPIIPWFTYLNKMLEPHGHIELNETVIVNVPSYFEALPALLSNTSHQALANYLLSNVVLESIPMLSTRLRKVRFNYIKMIYDTTEQELRWKECLNSATGDLTLAVNSLYAKKHFDGNSKENVMEILENVRDSFRKMLGKLDWMAEKTKETALEKLDAMVPYVAYANELLDDEKLDEYYGNLKLYPDSYFISKLSINLFNMRNVIKDLRKPVDKKDWKTKSYAAVVNAFYRDNDNSIQLSAGILQNKFFENGRPNYMNYGSIGSIIGHEMTHAFDDQGSEYDKDGNMMNWWDPGTKKEYEKRAKCMADQYSNYISGVNNQNINGRRTLGENIADNGGVKEAYYAYNEWVEKNGQEPKLFNLPFTPEQLFWISYTNVWCSKFRDGAMNHHILTNDHSPNEIRILGTLSNMPEFSRDFNCTSGTRMNPERKCEVW